MDIGSITLLIKENVGFVVTILLMLSGSAGIVKVILSRKSKDISIRVGKINGNNNSIAGRDVSKN